MRRGRRPGLVAALVTILGGVIVAGYFTDAAVAAQVPPTPTITLGPPNPTASTSTSFRYADSQLGVTFRCSMDGSSFASCASGGSKYIEGPDAHVFRVEAVSGHSTSSATRYTWRIDHTPPTTTLTFPTQGGTYNADAWMVGCVHLGVCGTARDASGVASVAVGIYQWSTGRYWNGSSFSSSSPVLLPATGTTSWRYAIARPMDGAYTLDVQATDEIGNTTATRDLGAADFTLVTKAPVAPIIVSGPTNPSDDTNPEFAFTDAEWPNVVFSCRLDAGPSKTCTGHTNHSGNGRAQGEINYFNLKSGSHCFFVFAADKATNVSPTTRRCWRINGRNTSFTIAGSIRPPLYPDTSQKLDLVFTNPNDSAITIAAGAVSITIATTQAGCSATVNFSVSHGLSTTVTVPRHSTRSLSDLGVAMADWPVISMIETHADQDACEGASLTLHYHGSASR